MRYIIIFIIAFLVLITLFKITENETAKKIIFAVNIFIGIIIIINILNHATNYLEQILLS